MSAMKPMMKPSRTTRLLGNQGWANKWIKHVPFARPATNGCSTNADHPHHVGANLGTQPRWATMVNRTRSSALFAEPESINSGRRILFRPTARLFCASRAPPGRNVNEWSTCLNSHGRTEPAFGFDETDNAIEALALSEIGHDE